MDESRMQTAHIDTGGSDDEARHNVVAHRERVVRRLFDAGLSERLLRLLLPDWSGLIERVAGVVDVLGEPATPRRRLRA